MKLSESKIITASKIDSDKIYFITPPSDDDYHQKRVVNIPGIGDIAPHKCAVITNVKK